MSQTRPELCAEVKKLLEKEIASLEERLQFYQLLLSIIEANCGKQVGGTRIIEYYSEDGRPAATIYRTRDSVRIVFIRPFPRLNPYIRYLVRTARQLSEENEQLTVNEEGDGEALKALTIQGLDKDTWEELELAIEYVMKRLKVKPSQREE